MYAGRCKGRQDGEDRRRPRSGSCVKRDVCCLSTGKSAKDYSLLEICSKPELAATVTLHPVNRLDVDAAIIFADIVTPLVGIGIDIKLVERVGPGH